MTDWRGADRRRHAVGAAGGAEHAVRGAPLRRPEASSSRPRARARSARARLLRARGLDWELVSHAARTAAPLRPRARTVAAGSGGGRLARRRLRGAGRGRAARRRSRRGPARARLTPTTGWPRGSSWEADGERLRLELQPVRWALRLLDDAADSLTALCVVRSEDGRWLAGRRAAWVSSWANRWALGAGGAVDLGETPPGRSRASFRRSGSSSPEALSVEALIALPNGLNMLVGLATVPMAAPGARLRGRRLDLVARRHLRLARRGGRAAQADGSPTGQLMPVPPMPQ